MKTTKKQSQCQRLLAYLRKHRKGITTMEAFEHLRITCVHKRISELENEGTVARDENGFPYWKRPYRITRTKERTATGSIVTRYKLAR
jgi:hypothetical protein